MDPETELLLNAIRAGKIADPTSQRAVYRDALRESIAEHYDLIVEAERRLTESEADLAILESLAAEVAQE